MLQESYIKSWKVYGTPGHRQRESFFDSSWYEGSKFNAEKNSYDVRRVNVLNSDVTGTNDYTIVQITRNTREECIDEFNGQLSDGIFENSRYGEIEEISEKEVREIIMNYLKRTIRAENPVDDEYEIDMKIKLAAEDYFHPRKIYPLETYPVSDDDDWEDEEESDEESPCENCKHFYECDNEGNFEDCKGYNYIDYEPKDDEEE